MKFFPVLLIVVFISFSVFSQERMTYPKVKIDIEKWKVYKLAKIGLPIDHGVKYEKNYLLA